MSLIWFECSNSNHFLHELRPAKACACSLTILHRCMRNMCLQLMHAHRVKEADSIHMLAVACVTPFGS